MFQIWLSEGGDHEAMRVVYRMRGLLGDATEEFVESLSNKSQNDVDNEEVYKMANVLADCGGLQVILFNSIYYQANNKVLFFKKIIVKFTIFFSSVANYQLFLILSQVYPVKFRTIFILLLLVVDKFFK